MKQRGTSRRVNATAQQVIASILLFETSDPLLRRVSITGVEVSIDRSVANVFYATSPESYEKTQKALENASGRIRSLMAQKLSWRVAPKLRFMLDSSVDEAERIGRALAAEEARGPVGEFDESNYKSSEDADTEDEW